MIKLLYIDLFCGAGGTSTGVENARYADEQCAKVIACVNHDANAIASHTANHPDALHFTEDIRTLELSPLVSHVKRIKKIYPDALIVLWASLECTNFSKAKGGQPRDADSRTLAEHLFRYIEAIDPDYIQIENVEEFMSWGDMDENGKPISKDKGRCYEKWKRNVRKYGYDFDWRILNAANYGAYTTRKRYFGIFAKRGLPIVFPEPTHCKDGKTDMMGRLEKWNAVKEVLDFTDEGDSIFCRKKPLAEKTLERIYAGLIKFVAGGKDAFIVKYNSMNRNGKYQPPSIDEPCPAITTVPKQRIVTPVFIDQQFGASSAASIEKPLGAITTNPKYSLVTCKGKSFLMNPQFASAGVSVDSPCFTLIARMDKKPPYFVNTEEGIGICIKEGDSPMTVKIKQFMILYGLADIKKRIFRISELKKIMGFPEDYVLIGTQSDQKKFIGNAVEVNMARALCEAICKEIIRKRKVA